MKTSIGGPQNIFCMVLNFLALKHEFNIVGDKILTKFAQRLMCQCPALFNKHFGRSVLELHHSTWLLVPCT